MYALCKVLLACGVVYRMRAQLHTCPHICLLLLLLLLEGDRHTSTASGGLAYEWMALS